MGVPALFRWLSRKYPKIISPVFEEDLNLDDPELALLKPPPSFADPNPNGEVDNLYLDMNGIVHPCSHPEHKPAPTTEDEMFLDIFTYTDRVLMMARPRKVLMIAVDGVAPRAKMNQQRARRFRSAKEAQLKEEEKNREMRERELRGETIDEAVKLQKAWDSNAITPGTPFMDRLAQALRYWVAYKLSSDPGWADLQVIISDATVPGEGEHKLMSFIRLQRLDPQYNPNTRHCIYGLDADLIFLGLATHEPHFRVLREDVFANQEKLLLVSQQMNLTQDQRDAIAKRDKRKPFLWLHVNVLREYLEVELFNPHLSFAFDPERAIDDWVFMCFFVGNDFLPHLPSLDVRDNGIDTLVNVWKRLLPSLKDYITCDGILNLEGVERLMESLSHKEQGIFQKRHENERRREDNNKRRALFLEEDQAMRKQYMGSVSKGADKAPIAADLNMPLMTTDGKNVDGHAQLTNKDIVANRDIITKANMANADAAVALKKLIASKVGASTDQTPLETTTEDEATDAQTIGSKRPAPNALAAADPDETGDAVRLWEPGFRTRYYQSKFECETAEKVDETRREVVRSYLEGISWVLLYYYQGCPSWQWYYPYHYAPFAADFSDCADIVGEQGIKFNLGQPFRPYEQLMSVLPAASGHSLPQIFRDMMSNPDSEIIDFYPVDFKIDMNGAKMSWQGIALLPFIDEKRLLAAVHSKYALLTEEETDRNTNKQDVLFISPRNKNFKLFTDKLYATEATCPIVFKFARSSLAGAASKVEAFNPQGTFKFPLHEGEMPDIENSHYLQVSYAMPPKVRGKSMLLNGYIPAVKALSHYDVMAMQQQGYQRNNNRYGSNADNSGYVNNGPSGKDLGLCYSMREGGYRSLTSRYSDPAPHTQGEAPHNGYNGQGHNYNTGRGAPGNNNGYQNHSRGSNNYNQHQDRQNSSHNYNGQHYNNHSGENYNNNYNGQNYNRGAQGGYNQSRGQRGGYRGSRGNRGLNRW